MRDKEIRDTRVAYSLAGMTISLLPLQDGRIPRVFVRADGTISQRKLARLHRMYRLGQIARGSDWLCNGFWFEYLLRGTEVVYRVRDAYEDEGLRQFLHVVGDPHMGMLGYD